MKSVTSFLHFAFCFLIFNFSFLSQLFHCMMGQEYRHGRNEQYSKPNIDQKFVIFDEKMSFFFYKHFNCIGYRYNKLSFFFGTKIFSLSRDLSMKIISRDLIIAQE